MQKLIVTKSMTYATRRMAAGDELEAPDRVARLLIAIGKARQAPQQQDAAPAPPKAPPKPRKRKKAPSAG